MGLILEEMLHFVSNSQCGPEKMKSSMKETSAPFEEQGCVFLKELKLVFHEGNSR